MRSHGLSPKELGKPNDNKKSFATATLIQVGGQRQLIAPAAEATIAYDPETGDELWRTLHSKDRGEGQKLPAIVMCNGWGGTKAFLMQSGIAPRFAAAGYVLINYDYRGWGNSGSRLVVRRTMPKPDEDGYVTVKAQAIREVVDPVDQQQDIDAAISYVCGEPMVDQDRIGIWGTSFTGQRLEVVGGGRGRRES